MRSNQSDWASNLVMAVCLSVWVIFILMLVVELPKKVGNIAGDSKPVSAIQAAGRR